MKKVLPNTSSKTQQGFTLIELMIAISIVAIMAVAGLLALSQAQRSGRDARRREEIQALATVIEAKKDPNSSTYSNIAGTDFPSKGGNIPTDTTTQQYCIALWTTTPTGALPSVTNWSGSACPASTPSWGGTAAAGAWSALDASSFTAGTAKAWMLCANLEANAKPFCITSSQ